MATDNLTLHQQHDSGNSYKVRLTASLLGIKFDNLIEYNTFKGETRTPDFLSKINANGRVPVLQIGQDTFLPEGNAACYYLATDSSLVPKDRLRNAQMLQWMFFEQYTHEPAIAVLRIWLGYIGETNLNQQQKMLLPSKRKQGTEALDLMNGHLQGREWFVGEHVSLADICLFAYTHVADAGGFDLKQWPDVDAWCQRMKLLNGFVGLKD